MTYVETLNEAYPNPSLYGGKGSNLIKMLKLGIRVPPGFLVNTIAYKKFINDSPLKEEIYSTLGNDYKPKDVIALSTKIKNFFLTSKIPHEIMKEIKKKFTDIYKKIGKENSFSVRSSANIEDTSNFSFAGQAESYLNKITLEEILEAIKNCWISLYSPNALLYLLQMRKNKIKISLNDLKMAVIIQKMVKSQVSGVLFTANVLNNKMDEMLINSTWGLGETITSNLIIPDLIILNKQKFEIIRTVIGDKEKSSVSNPKGSSTILIPTEQNLKESYSLNESQLFKLYKLGLKLEKCLNYPQDIEWAIEDNKIYTLQSRPITTLRKGGILRV
ncbi:MAG: PEP/pyruvate-binding domain-containing protein [Candidatus Lokiarchaeota archaeon]|nr:PEP/pyruvate-binding domain-containing protein [Candidatus Lokiarchaeota archaeon]